MCTNSFSSSSQRILKHVRAKKKKNEKKEKKVCANVGEAKIRTPKGERLLPAPSTVTDGDVEITGQSVEEFPFNEES